MEPTRNNRPVMDIQPRVATGPVSRPTVTTSRPTVPPVTSQPQTPLASVPPERNQFEPAQPEPAKPVSNDSESSLPPRARTPIAAIIVALIVAGGLAGLTVLTFLKTQKQSQDKVEPTASQTVAPEEVDTTSTAIDEELNTLNDTQDFDTTTISDEALGL